MDEIKHLEMQDEVKKGIAIIKQNHEGVVARLNQISKDQKLKARKLEKLQSTLKDLKQQAVDKVRKGSQTSKALEKRMDEFIKEQMN